MEKNEKKTVTYNDIFNVSILLNAMPLTGIKGKSLCDIIMLRVDYGKIINAFDIRMQEGLKKLKEEKYPKFDEESQKKEGDRCEEYQTWLAELESLWGGMRNDAAAKEVEEKVPAITRDILTAFCEQGVEGEITLPGGTEASPNLIPKATALHMLAARVED